MGGQNCPPPYADRPMPGVREEYITKLATYCQSMFAGAESYFGAHVKIEAAVLGEDILTEAIGYLKRSEECFLDARSKIGSVASLYEQLGGSDVNFGEQLENLTVAVDMIGAVRMEIELLENDGIIQDALWAEPAITNNFAAATTHISVVLAWQTEFARQKALIIA